VALTKIPANLLDTSSGFDLQGNITLGDNEQIQLGASSDLQIYHDGINSYIKEIGPGALVLQSAGPAIVLEKTDGENMLLANVDGAVTLYYNGSAKIATTSTGATVTGNLAVTGDLDITGNVNSASVTDLDVTDKTITLGAGQTEALSGGSGIIIDGSSASILWDETNDTFDINKGLTVGSSNNDLGTTAGNQLTPLTLRSDTANVDSLLFTTERLSNGNTWSTAAHRIQRKVDATKMGYIQFGSNSDDLITFGKGNNEKMRLDGSGRLAIGTDSPDGNLHIFSSSAGTVSAATDANELVLEATSNVGMTLLSGNSAVARIRFGDADSNSRGNIFYNHSSDSFGF